MDPCLLLMLTLCWSTCSAVLPSHCCVYIHLHVSVAFEAGETSHCGNDTWVKSVDSLDLLLLLLFCICLPSGLWWSFIHDSKMYLIYNISYHIISMACEKTSSQHLFNCTHWVYFHTLFKTKVIIGIWTHFTSSHFQSNLNISFCFTLPLSRPEGQLCLFHYPPCLTITLPPPLPSAPSAPPQEVRLFSLSSTSIKVSWVAPPTDSRHGDIVSYSLAYQAPTGEDTERHQVSGISADFTSYVLEDLEKWVEYLVWVRAHTDVGPGPESPAARIRTKEDGMFMMSLGSGNSNPPTLTLLLSFSSSSFRCCCIVV